MLETVDLECTRGERVLFGDLSLRVEAGSLLRVHGPNGSGKTSLLRLICGLLQPSAGEVRWRGRSIRALREDYWRELLYVGHRNGVKDELTVAENLNMAAAIAGRAVSDERAAHALDAVGLHGFERTPARHLSQGQCRRIALARLFLYTDTPLWILDEPFTALDTDGVEVLRNRLGEHIAAGNLAILTTHQDVSIAADRAFDVTLGGPGAAAC